MTKYIATQHGRENIRCNAILPGLILDPELEAKVKDMAEMIKRHLLLTRNGRLEDIAGLAAFFASDDLSFVTGQEISCDGGLVILQTFFADEPEAGLITKEPDRIFSLVRNSKRRTGKAKPEFNR